MIPSCVQLTFYLTLFLSVALAILVSVVFFDPDSPPLLIRFALLPNGQSRFVAVCHQSPCLVSATSASFDLAFASHGSFASADSPILPCGSRTNITFTFNAHHVHRVIPALPCRDAVSRTRIAFGSCSAALRGGFGARKLFSWLAEPAQRVDAMLVLGDGVYVDTFPGIDTKNPEVAYRRLWSNPAWVELTSKIPLYAMLDDHEISNNYDKGRHTPEYARGIAAWDKFLGAQNPDPVSDDVQGFEWALGGISMFVADTRSYMMQPEGLLGAAQRQALHRFVQKGSDALSAARKQQRNITDLTVVASPVALMPRFAATHREGWWQHHGELDGVLRIWRADGDDRDVPLTLLSGDIHCTAHVMSAPPGQRRVQEFASSPMFCLPLGVNFARNKGQFAGEDDFEHEKPVFWHTNFLDGFHVSFLDVERNEQNAIVNATVTVFKWGLLTWPPEQIHSVSLLH